MNFDVVINLDDNFVQHAMAMLCSLYENNHLHVITVHVLTDHLSSKAKEYLQGLTDRYNNRIVFYNVDSTPLEGVQFREKRPLSMAAYFRLLLADILPNSIDKILYLDVDMIVLKDVSEIFELELDGYGLAATLDQMPYTSQHRLQLHIPANQKTFCSGLMYLNLSYWRENNVTPKLLEYAKRRRKEVHLHDQDVLNYFFKNSWFLLSPKWNRYATSNRALRCDGYQLFDYQEYCLDPYIIHYAAVGVKPWFAAPTPLKKLYIKYLKLSGYREIKFSKVSLREKFRLSCLTFRNYIGFKIHKLSGRF